MFFGLKSSVKIHFSATDKIRVVIYLTPEAPVAVIAPVIPPKRDTREYSPGRAQAKAAPKGKYSEKTAVEDIQKERIPHPSCVITVRATVLPCFSEKIPAEEMLAKKITPKYLLSHPNYNFGGKNIMSQRQRT